MKKLILIIILFNFLIGCSKLDNFLNSNTGKNSESVSNTTLIETNQSKDIEFIEIFRYSSGSIKAQPELIIVISDTEEIKRFIEWKNEIIFEKPLLIHEINELYFIQVDYKDGSREYIVYTIDNKGDHYIQIYSTFPKIWVDQYDEKTKSEILVKLNESEWFKVNPIPFIMNLF